MGKRRFRLVERSRQTYEEVLREASTFQPGGEGEDHLRLKKFIARNPQVLGLPSGLVGEEEYPLPSGDSVDVLFRNGEAWIAVEVKAKSSPVHDVLRGLFQCIKYKAVIEARLKSLGLPMSAQAILVLEAALPQRLVPLKDILGLDVRDKVIPR